MTNFEINELLDGFLKSDALPPSLARSLTQTAQRRIRDLFKVRYLADQHKSHISVVDCMRYAGFARHWLRKPQFELRTGHRSKLSWYDLCSGSR